ncbi:MAG TPA: sensor domain-containing diguanylate cyclase [Acidimicrobiia bacterium]|nr:sensor domain-containing diguanylate cyclase [Acidimicrobiia bacterium]
MTEQDRAEARAEAGSIARNAALGGVALVAVTYFFTGALLRWVAPEMSGFDLVALGTGVAAVLSAPLLWALATISQNKGLDTGSVRVARERQMRAEARRREFATRLSKALEMARNEPDALDATARALGRVVPRSPAELLLADNSRAHLERMAVSAPGGEPPGCPVDSPDACVAARSGQTEVFADSEDLDACPRLRGRPAGPCAAVCVPVAIMGRSVGVVHVTTPVGEAMPDEAVDELQILANQVGNRLGMLRVMAETQLQAATDGLTGLLNRRSLENEMRALRRSATPFVFVMADLDHFKPLNDTHGHESGDRTLRAFAQTLRSVLRTEDLVSRYGGDEFGIVMPDCSIDDAVAAMERVREQLVLALRPGDAPNVTASFGLAAADPLASTDEIVARADRALYRAKFEGRNRVVVYSAAADAATPVAARGEPTRPDADEDEDRTLAPVASLTSLMSIGSASSRAGSDPDLSAS